MESFRIGRGKINFVFPVETPPAWKRLVSEASTFKESAVEYRGFLNSFIRDCCHRHIRFSWGLTWLPDTDWSFKPHTFGVGDKLRRLLPEAERATVAAEALDSLNDVRALVAFDEFQYPISLFRAQPFIRLRLRRKWRVVKTNGEPAFDAPQVVDLNLFPAIGQAHLVFRQPVVNSSPDELIAVRLAQFREGSPYRWQSLDGDSSPIELLDSYRRECMESASGIFRLVHAVRRYATVVELIQACDVHGIELSLEKLLRRYYAALYGILCADEGWRATNRPFVEDYLRKASFTTRRDSIHFSQEVTFLTVRQAPQARIGLAPDSYSAISRYHRALHQNRNRTVADGGSYTDLVIAQEGYLQSLHEEAKRLLAGNRLARKELVGLRRRASMATVQVVDMLNVFSGFRAMFEESRGIGILLERLNEIVDALGHAVEDLRSYQSEFATDLINGALLGVGFAAVGSAAGWLVSADAAARAGVVALVAFATVRVGKYPRNTSTWLIVLSAIAVLLALIS